MTDLGQVKPTFVNWLSLLQLLTKLKSVCCLMVSDIVRKSLFQTVISQTQRVKGDT